MRSWVIILITLIALIIGGYFYWIGSPYYAFQQVATALKDHNKELFDTYVDAPEMIDHFLDDLLVQPAMSTPNLSPFQQSVAGGALTMARSQITKGIIESLSKYLSAEGGDQQRNTGYFQSFGCEAAIANPIPIYQGGMAGNSAPGNGSASGSASGSGGLKDLLNAAGREMSSEVGKLKSVAFNRMLAYIQAHPNTVPGRLLDCPPAQRAAHARQMMEEYGLAASNFKGLASCVTTTDILGRQSSRIGFNFFSPKINKQIVVEVQVDKDLTSGIWRIDRLSNLKEVMDQEEEFYDRDLHELVEYSHSGMRNSNLATDIQSMGERIKQNPAAQSILNKLHLNFR